MSDISKIKINDTTYNVKDSLALRDAPLDGEEYVRKNGEWRISSGGSGGGGMQSMYYYQQPVNTASNAEIFRITDSRINTDTIVLECTFENPSYITSDVSWTSYSGYIAFTGTCSTATTANVTLGYATPDNYSDRLMTLLWENPSPTVAFPAQTISIGLSEYDYILVNARIDTGTTESISEIIPVGGSRAITNMWNYRWARAVTVSTTGVTFGTGNSADKTDDLSTNNSCMIPTQIYGVSRYNEFTSSHINPVDVTTKTRVATAANSSINAYVVPKSGYYAAITHTNQTVRGLGAVIAADSELRNLYTSNYSSAGSWLSLTTEWIWLKEGTTIYWAISYESDSRYANDLGLFYADPVS